MVTDPFNTPNPFEDEPPAVEETTPEPPEFNTDKWAFTKEPWADTIDSFDVARILGITPNHLRQLTFRKKLTVIGRKNKKALYAKTEVEAYLNRNVTNQGA